MLAFKISGLQNMFHPDFYDCVMYNHYGIHIKTILILFNPRDSQRLGVYQTPL